jgi:hypothetical protein
MAVDQHSKACQFTGVIRDADVALELVDKATQFFSFPIRKGVGHPGRLGTMRNQGSQNADSTYIGSALKDFDDRFFDTIRTWVGLHNDFAPP